jgi:hypothetical protein
MRGREIYVVHSVGLPLPCHIAAAAAAAAAGAKFFPGFLTDKRRSALDAAALAWQAEGKAQLNTLARVSLGQDQAILIPPAGVCMCVAGGAGDGVLEGGGFNGGKA